MIDVLWEAIMGSFRTWAKQITIVKNYRIKKWKRYSKRMMFLEYETKRLEKEPWRIRNAVQRHIKNTSAIPDNIEDELDIILSRSYLSKTETITDDLKSDMLFWYFAYGFTFNEYLCYQFIDKSREERMRFLSDRESVLLGYDMNDINDMVVFGDKMNTYERYCDYFGREAISLESALDYDKYLAFIKKYDIFVKKNVFKSCGQGVELIDISTVGKTERELFEDFLLEGKVILEEVVKQGKETAAFNESSVNTIRCITLKTKIDTLVPYCFMKTGRSGAFVDNGGAGGILVGVNSATGALGTDGVDENGIRYDTHPDSKIKFKGYQLPEWDKMISICKSMAEATPKVRMIGWDMAYTDYGWIVIEGNAMTEVIGPQSTWLRGIREDVNKFYTYI